MLQGVLRPALKFIGCGVGAKRQVAYDLLPKLILLFLKHWRPKLLHQAGANNLERFFNSTL